MHEALNLMNGTGEVEVQALEKFVRVDFGDEHRPSFVIDLESPDALVFADMLNRAAAEVAAKSA